MRSSVVVDPVDGSTNASRGIPWYATSLCAVDDDGPLAALVVNLASGVTLTRRERGAWGRPQTGSRSRRCSRACLAESLVALSGYPGKYLGWYQYRALGAAALDLCAVAEGVVDGYVDCSSDAHGAVGLPRRHARVHRGRAVVVDLDGAELVVAHPDARRSVVAAATPELLAELVAVSHRARDEGT